MLAAINDHVLTHEHTHTEFQELSYPHSHENGGAFLEQEPAGLPHFDMPQYQLAKELVTTRSLNVKKINKRRLSRKISVSGDV
jgi:hypothetical protein